MFDKEQYQKAEVTIVIGDYKITMNGEMKPPLKHDKYHDEIRFDRDLSFRDVETTVNMSIRSPNNIEVERWRWIIPVAIKPRIES